MNSGRRKHDFELFGFDFLIDEDFRVWLIEVNTNPYLGVPNDFIRHLLPKMMHDLLEIVVDPVFKPANKKTTENEFEIIYCEVGSTYSPDGLSFSAR
jgi:hypothetical protein